MVPRISDKHLSLIGNINSKRVFKFTLFCAFFAKLEFESALGVQHDNPVIDAIHQVIIAAGANRDIAGLVNLRPDFI